MSFWFAEAQDAENTGVGGHVLDGNVDGRLIEGTLASVQLQEAATAGRVAARQADRLVLVGVEDVEAHAAAQYVHPLGRLHGHFTAGIPSCARKITALFQCKRQRCTNSR